MRTAYEALRRAVVKDFGRWYRKEWRVVTEDAKERIRQGVAYNHFGNPFLHNLSDLCIGTCPHGMCYIRGKQSGGWYFDSEYDDNLKRLKEFKLSQHYWVYSSFSFDDWFELVGFKSKQAAVKYYKKQKKREDSLFYTFWYRW